MPAFAFASAISLALAGPSEAAPRRVASLNLCTDELVLMLGAPEQIVSVTHLAQNRNESPLWRQARRYSRNDGSLISVASMRPDLVIGMARAGGDRVRIAERLGLRTIDLPFPQSLLDVGRSIAVVARALRRESEGAQILRHMAQLQRTAPERPVPAAFLGGGGRSLAAQGLGADWMRLAGLHQRRLPGDRLSLEQMLVQPPPVLLRSDYREGQYSREQRWLDHPLALRAQQRSRMMRTDGRLWTCMGPLMIAEVLRLRTELTR